MCSGGEAADPVPAGFIPIFFTTERSDRSEFKLSTTPARKPTPMKTLIANQTVIMTGNSFATCGKETNAIEGDAPLHF